MWTFVSWDTEISKSNKYPMWNFVSWDTQRETQRERERVVYTCGLYAVDSVCKWCGCEARWCMDKSRLSSARPWWSCKSEEQLEPSMRSSHHSRCSLTHASLQFSIKLCVQKVYGHSASSCSVCSEHLLKNDDMGFVLPSWIECCCWSCWHDW